MDTRRDFVKMMVVNGAIFLPYLRAQSRSPGLSDITAKAPANPPDSDNPLPRSRELGNVLVDDPYADVDWEGFKKIPSATHLHITDPQQLDKAYHSMGLRHMPISNYYPSVPTYPIKSIRYNQYKIEQDFGLIYNGDNSKPGNAKWADGHFVKGPFRWNDIIMKGQNSWFHELPSELQSQLPFQLGDFIFKDVPDDIIVSPNAEHHSFTDTGLHACAVGSLYSSGNFDVHDDFKTQEHGYAIGTGLPWEVAFRKMIDGLLFPDAGGVTINHPVWSHLPFDEVVRMLDFDHRVLGIEVFNDTCATGYGDPTLGWALKLWDQILTTGRRCLGFFVPDHTIVRGRNVLLVPRFTEHECLKAYREGAFYGAIDGSGLGFRHIKLTGGRLSIATNKNCAVLVTTNLGLKKFAAESGKPVIFDIPLTQEGIPAVSFVRAEAIDDSSELIYSQPIRFVG
jgi:hypothetical protein